MLLKNRTTVGLAALALAGGAMMLAMPAANAATMKCGDGCVTLASQKYGTTDVVAAGQSSAGTLAAFWYSNSEDFSGQLVGNVHNLAKAGLIAKSIDKTYDSDAVYQYEYAPRGIASGNCLGTTAGSTAVTLLPCGVDSSTLWVGLSGHQSGNFEPLMSAALSTKSAMLLTAPSTATGALAVTQMALSTTVSNGVTTVSDSPFQMWETVAGAYGNSSVSSELG